MPEEPYGPPMASGRGQRGQLRQLPSGRWQARYRDAAGKRHTATFDTKKQAQSWLADRLDTVEAVRGGDTAALIATREAGLTVREMIQRFLAVHEADAPTIAKLTAQLRQVEAAFGDRLAASVEGYELAVWRKTLPAGYAYDVFRALRQVYAAGVRYRWVPSNPGLDVKNPRPRRAEVGIPPWEAILAIRSEIDLRYLAAPIVLAGAGLRLEEFLALERRDVDLDARVLHVRRVWSSGRLVELGADGSKTWRQRRNVPLRQMVVDALREQARRIDTPLLFAAPEGGYLRSENFRSRVWKPACDAAGVDYFPAKNLRHVYASEMLANTVPTLTVARRMGTSLQMIEDTYGHLIPDETAAELQRLDAWDATRAASR